jgi:hypothetical protein
MVTVVFAVCAATVLAAPLVAGQSLD